MENQENQSDTAAENEMVAKKLQEIEPVEAAAAEQGDTVMTPSGSKSSLQCSNDASSSKEAELDDDKDDQNIITLTIVWGKKKFQTSTLASQTVVDFRTSVEQLTGVPPSMQKLMYKGQLKDGATLAEAGVVDGAKVMLVGSTLQDVIAVTVVDKDQMRKEGAKAIEESKEPLSKQKMHAKIIDKGIPEDAMVGIKGAQESLPATPLTGMLNKAGGKVRLTFKLETDELWISTKERTNKIPMSSISDVMSEPIEGYEQYHIMAIQLGPTAASRYWVYWVPAQYARSIKNTIGT